MVRLYKEECLYKEVAGNSGKLKRPESDKNIKFWTLEKTGMRE